MILHPFHHPVLLPQVIDGLNIRRGKWYLDATLGGGGHGLEILKHGGKILGIDQDESALIFSRQKFLRNGFVENRDFILKQSNFGMLDRIHEKSGKKFFGALFDLGISSYQLDVSNKGFTFNKDEFLDMRMGNISGIKTAYDIVNKYSKEKLYEIFTKYSEELNSRAIATAIVRARSIREITTTSDLVRIIREVVGDHDIKKVLARIFQSLRIEVNDELSNLKKGLRSVFDLIENDGRLCTISYHSIEDRIIKNFIRGVEIMQSGLLINKNVLSAEKDEIIINPRSRSAKLRILEKHVKQS